jgi:hypothetical protein
VLRDSVSSGCCPRSPLPRMHHCQGSGFRASGFRFLGLGFRVHDTVRSCTLLYFTIQHVCVWGGEMGGRKEAFKHRAGGDKGREEEEAKATKPPPPPSTKPLPHHQHPPHTHIYNAPPPNVTLTHQRQGALGVYCGAVVRHCT